MLKKTIRYLFLWSGIFFFLMIILACTRVPYDMHRWLGITGSGFRFAPTTIVMFGGSGMPSESNLIRLFYFKEIALNYPESRLILAHPNDTGVIRQMTAFLYAFDIDSTRVSALYGGSNTREQALKLIKNFPGIENEKIVVVTSPEHMFRTLKTMRRLQFKNVGGLPAFENPMFIDLGYDHRKIGGSVYVPDVSGSLTLRYNFWNYLKLEITCLREYCAILYYKLNGWM